MNSKLKYVTLILIATVLLVSCDSYPSLQKYYVDSKEDINFIAIDIPASILKLKNEDVSDDVREALNSIKKVNFLGFQLKDENAEKYTAEKLKIKAILANPKYQELIQFGNGGKSLVIKFLGESDAIDEIILYGYDKELGLALVRVLGDKMNPTQMMTLVKEIQLDDDSGALKQIKSFVENVK
jgi:phage pi2 protein 07